MHTPGGATPPGRVADATGGRRGRRRDEEEEGANKAVGRVLGGWGEVVIKRQGKHHLQQNDEANTTSHNSRHSNSNNSRRSLSRSNSNSSGRGVDSASGSMTVAQSIFFSAAKIAHARRNHGLHVC